MWLAADSFKCLVKEQISSERTQLFRSHFMPSTINLALFCCRCVSLATGEIRSNRNRSRLSGNISRSDRCVLQTGLRGPGSILTWSTMLRYSLGANLLRFKNHLQPGPESSVLLGDYSSSLASAARYWWWPQGEGKNSKSSSSCTIAFNIYIYIYIYKSISNLFPEITDWYP